MKTLKQLINEYFEERVQVSELGYVCYDSFLNVSADLIQGIEDYGIDGAFPQWYDFTPECWGKNLVPAIKNYINNTLEPQYRKWATITK
ncbi:MAG: hypothetical protein IKZ34_03585 [Alphaproteobacteria bacterium]|nr:hypothetical protein [Alphaproteobacteria bacterium]